MSHLLPACLRLFRGRDDVYATAFAKLDEGGEVVGVSYALTKEPLTESVWKQHLTGKRLIGRYQLMPDSSVCWFAMDFDGDTDDQASVLEQATRQAEAFENAGLLCYIEQSRSGSGAHVWGFFDEPVSAELVRKALKPLLVKSANFDRLYPVQTKVSESKPYGNLIALPFFGAHAPEEWSSRLGAGVRNGASVFLNRDTYEPIDPEEFVASVLYNRSEVIEELAERAPVELETTAGTRNLPVYQDYEPVPYGETDPRGRPEKPFNGVLKLISDYGCRFMAHAFTERMTLPEPQWYAAIQQLTCFQNGREAAHLLSMDYPGYTPGETDAKYTQALRHPPVGCRYIKEHFPELACKDCNGRAPYHVGNAKITSLIKETTEPMIKSTFGASLDRMRRRNRGEVPTGAMWRVAGLDRYTRLRPKEMTVVGALPSIGKAQPLDAQILTPTGFRNMGDIRVGDLVITASGSPTPVVGVYPQGQREVYRVVTDDGCSTECCDEHLWLTSTRADRRSDQKWSVKSLSEIRSSLTREDTGGPAHAIPVVGPVVFAPDKPLPFDPYALGLLIGDGNLVGSTYRFSNAEDGVVSALRTYLEKVGDTLVKATGVDWRIVRKQRAKEGSHTKVALAALGIDGLHSYEKYIPEPYLFASVADRLALLQGLCDTDGSLYSGSTTEYSTSSAMLAAQVAHLVRSLGGQASISTRTTKYTYKGEVRQGRQSFRVFIRLHGGMSAFRSKKHSARQKNTQRTTYRSIVAVEPVGVKPVQCIAVEDSSHLYVTDDFIVTHNTALMVDAMFSIAESGTPTLGFSAETGREGLEERLLARVSGVDSRAIRGERMWNGVLQPLTADEERAVEQAAEYLASLPLYLHYSASQPDLIFNLLEDTILREKLSIGKPLVIFYDYLQFGAIDVEGQQSEYEKLSRLSMELKYMAKILRQPVVVFSQLQRKVEADDEPQINWFKGTGRIEADADVAMILTGERTPGAVSRRKLTIVKQRDGDAGVALDLLLHQTVCRFEVAPNATETTVAKDIFALEPNAFTDF